MGCLPTPSYWQTVVSALKNSRKRKSDYQADEAVNHKKWQGMVKCTCCVSILETFLDMKVVCEEENKSPGTAGAFIQYLALAFICLPPVVQSLFWVGEKQSTQENRQERRHFKNGLVHSILSGWGQHMLVRNADHTEKVPEAWGLLLPNWLVKLLKLKAPSPWIFLVPIFFFFFHSQMWKKLHTLRSDAKLALLRFTYCVIMS